MKKVLLINLLLLCCSFCSGQTLIPYLSQNGQYGYADVNGKLLYPAEYEMLEAMPEGENMAKCKKDGKSMILFRNGITYPDKSFAPLTTISISSDTPGKLDTIHNPVAFWQEKKLHMASMTSKTIRQFSFGIPFKESDWFTGETKNPVKNDVVFKDGFLRVFLSKDSVNMVDTNLNLVFPRYFAAVKVVDDQYFIVAEKSHKMTVGHRDGHLIGEFVWNNIEPAARSGYFIVNNPTPQNYRSKAGVINAKGELIIDTIYQRISLGGTNGLILQKAYNQNGLADYDGNLILPVSEWQLYPLPSEDYLIAQFPDHQFNIINRKGEKMWTQSFSNIRHWDNNPAYAAMNWLQTGIPDPLNQEKIRIGIRTLSNEIIVPEEYTFISFLLRSGNRFLVKNDSLFGLLNEKGGVVLPCRFSGWSVEKMEQGQDIFWGQIPATGNWTAYDLNGIKLPFPDYFKPTKWQDDVVYFNRGEDIRRIDGSLIPNKPEWQSLYLETQVRTTGGAFVVLTDNNHLVVLDGMFRHIMPKGFGIYPPVFEKERLENTGLLPVFRFPENIKDTALFLNTPFVRKVNPVKSGEIMETIGDEAAGGGFWPTSQRSVPKVPAFPACGVINSKGEWVLPPKNDVWYFPLSEHLVVELPYGEGFYGGIDDFNHFKIHIVNMPKKSMMQVSYIGRRYLGKNKTIALGIIDPKTNRRVFAYFDNKGAQLTTYYFANGPNFLRKTSFAAYYKAKESESTLVLINDKGEVKSEFNHFVRPNSLFDSQEAGPFDYFCLMKEGTRQWGLFDSTGTMLLPDLYANLKIINKFRYLSCTNPDNSATLMTWKGEKIFAFQDCQQIDFIECPDQSYWFCSRSEAVHISPENTVLQHITDCCFTRSYTANDMKLRPGFIYCINTKGQKIWLNAVTGKVFR